MTRSRMLAIATAAVLPLAATTPAEATTVPCNGSYTAVGGVASQQCTFVYLGGTVTASISISGAYGYKYVTIGVYPGGQWCENEGYTTATSCRFTFTPNVAAGTVMTCSSAAVGHPYGAVTYSCQ